MSLLKTVFRYFLSGVIALLPFVITVAVVLWLSNFFIIYLGPETFFGKCLKLIGIRFADQGIMAYIFGWLIVLLVIFAIGFFIDVFTKKVAIRYFDYVIKKIPIISPIYGTARQFTDLINTEGNQEIKNMSPVFCRLGNTLVLALTPTADQYEIEGISYRIVIVPTAPIPFGGAMILVPSTDVFAANMKIDSLINFYVSMGVSGNESLKKVSDF
ncbi:MAG: DUF502 domain-containing protein [Planctomycetia bacterium]|nr:DUF502 domain-containing protein [Planctomycetia bacterium]